MLQRLSEVMKKGKPLKIAAYPIKGERWGSNPRPSEPQSDALTN